MTTLKTFRIPINTPVFILEDMEERILWFRERLKGAKNVGLCKTATGAITLLRHTRFEIVFLDHDLGFLDAADPSRPDGNGKEVARYLHETHFPGLIVLHSLNGPARNLMAGILPQAIIAPFGTFDITLI